MKKWLILLFAASAFGAATPEAALEKAVRKSLGHAATIEVHKVSLNRPWPGNAEVRILNPDHPYGLVAFEGGGVNGTAEVRAVASVVVASTPIYDGDSFTSNNTRLEERELTRVAAGGYHTDLKTLAPMRARGRVMAGSVIGIRQTQAPVLVQPGQLVDLVIDRNGMKVKARVEALQRGRDQEWIRVRNPSTRKVLQAKVVEEGIVTL